MNSTDIQLDIEKVETSRIDQVDFSNLQFGKQYADHMMYCDYIDGEWQTPKIVPYGPMEFEPSAKVFHYGQAVFEGMKAFKDDDGQIWLFRPEQNFERINKSSKRMAIPEFPKEHFFASLQALLKLDQDWVKKGQGNSLYIRPFVIATENGVSASESDRYRFMIIGCPAQAYYNKPIKVIFAQDYSRAADGGVGFAKAAGNYGAQFYPTKLAKEKGLDQIIWTDASSHEYLEEAGTMNIFFRIGDKLLTAPTNDRILDGVTRKSIIQLAKDNDVEVIVDKVSVKYIVEAARKGELKEIFGAGTAATVVRVEGFEYDGEYFDLPAIDKPYGTFFKSSLQDIQYNRVEDPHGWTVKAF
ncbi:branched-chain amino acid aminotransferase [Psychroflexus sp. YR1-1]|uniref:Branched-chain-amino-acid aminotransferase n=1 Tax=Psychroflexus aurantiacus TaxID=2709310 RepID=A0A6B3R8D4_9FLAO|nr:branched-chain amino acid aminotransferase [Psychroflexus aurantiacus]NEV93921.1 branched-chain amino acid aminotransferase [Psychroflexus aurantiacus]